MISCDIDNLKNHFTKAGDNSVFVSHIHLSLSVGNTVVFLNAMERLQNNVGEARNNIVHKDRSYFDSKPHNINIYQIKTLRADLDIHILAFKSISWHKDRSDLEQEWGLHF